MSNNTWGRLWDPYVDTAIGAWKRGDKLRTDKIISLLIQVLQQGERYSSVDENLVKGLYTVADQLCLDREYSRVEWIYLRILEIQEEILGPDDPQALDTLLRLRGLILASGVAPDASEGKDAPANGKN